jgi:F-type H+-transporting ATPase subunit delta
MAELSTSYATALFELTQESGTLEQCLEQAVVVRDALAGSECRSILEHPHISGSEKSAFLDKVFAGKIDQRLNDFLKLLIKKNRESIMPSALTVFINMGKRISGLAEANVVSAEELDNAQVTALKGTLSKKLGKQVELTLQVDPSLIGGLYIYADGHYMDYTIKKQLIDMKKCVQLMN